MEQLVEDYSIQERVACCLWFDVSRSTDDVQQRFTQRFGQTKIPPPRQDIRLWYQRFIKTGCLIHDDNGNWQIDPPSAIVFDPSNNYNQKQINTNKICCSSADPSPTCTSDDQSSTTTNDDEEDNHSPIIHQWTKKSKKSNPKNKNIIQKAKTKKTTTNSKKTKTTKRNLRNGGINKKKT